MPPESALHVRVEFFYHNLNEPLNETPEEYWNRKGKQWADSLDQFINKKDILVNELRFSERNYVPGHCISGAASVF